MKSLKIGRRSPGGLIKIDDHEQKEPEDRKPPGRGPLAISPTLKEVIVWRSSEIINNFQRKIKRSVDSILGIYTGPTKPHISPPLGKNLVRPSPPIDANVDKKIRVLKCGLHFQVSDFNYEITHLTHP